MKIYVNKSPLYVNFKKPQTTFAILKEPWGLLDPTLRTTALRYFTVCLVMNLGLSKVIRLRLQQGECVL